MELLLLYIDKRRQASAHTLTHSCSCVGIVIASWLVEMQVGTQAQVESLAAFLSDWAEYPLASNPMPTSTEAVDTNEDPPHQHSSPHLPAAPAPDLPTTTLRRRNKYIDIVTNGTEINDDGEMYSLHTTSLRLREQHHFNFNHRQTLHREQETMSPSCIRTALLYRTRSVGGQFTPLPPLPFLPVGARPVDTE